MLRPSSYHITAALTESPEGTQDRNRMPAIKSQTLHPLTVALRRLRMRKKRYWPQMADIHIKGMISVSSDSCIFSYIEEC